MGIGLKLAIFDRVHYSASIFLIGYLGREILYNQSGRRYFDQGYLMEYFWNRILEYTAAAAGP